MKGFVDIHQHLVWGVDDGAQTIEESKELLLASAKQGIRVIFCTSHLTSGIKPFPYEIYRDHFLTLREICKEENIPIKLLPAAEVFYTEHTLNMLLQKRIPTMNGSKYILVEFSEDASWENIEHAVCELYRNGYIPIVAHVERYKNFVIHFKSAIRLHEEVNVYYQMNCGAVLNPRNFIQKKFVDYMLKNEYIDAIATDSHNMEYRPPRMLEAFRFISKKYGREYAERLTHFGL